MRPYFSDKFYNPSALYGAAQEVHRDLQAARAMVAQTIGARTSEVIFTAGGTEANNLAVSGVLQHYPGSRVIISGIEHDSVLGTARQFDCAEAPVTEQGIVDLAALEKLVDDRTVLISIMYANNEIGTVQPIRDIAAMVERIRHERKHTGVDRPLYLHTDAAQAGNYLDLHAARLGIDLMVLNGGKVYGPKQSGALYVRSGVRLKPQILGGGQEKGMRSGTENVPGAVGFARALKLAHERRNDEVRRLRSLQEQFIDGLRKQIPGVRINGSLRKRLPNNVHVTIPGQDNERLLFGLDEHGIQAAAGSACGAGSGEPSHVLRAIGLSDDDARASLRFSMGRGTTAEMTETTVRTLVGLLA